MDTLVGSNSRQDFDVLAMMGILKDMPQRDYIAITEAVRCGNQAVLQALACGDKSALLAAAGIERQISDTYSGLLREGAAQARAVTQEINETARDNLSSLMAAMRELEKGQCCDSKSNLAQFAASERQRSEDKHELTRAIDFAQRDNLRGLDNVENRLGARLDYGFGRLDDKIGNVLIEQLKNGYEAQLRDKDNTTALLNAMRDAQDATIREARDAREERQRDRIEQLHDELISKKDKIHTLKSEQRLHRDIDRLREERFHHHGYLGEVAVPVRPVVYGRRFVEPCVEEGYPYAYEEEGCAPRRRPRESLRAQQDVKVYVNDRRFRRNRDTDDDDHGHGHHD